MAKKSLPLSETNSGKPSEILKTGKSEIQRKKASAVSQSSSKMKENNPLDMIAHILSGGAEANKEKSVRMADTVAVISEDGLTESSQLETSSKGKLKPSAAKSGSSKFRSVTKCSTSRSEESPGECQQQ